MRLTYKPESCRRQRPLLFIPSLTIASLSFLWLSVAPTYLEPRISWFCFFPWEHRTVWKLQSWPLMTWNVATVTAPALHAPCPVGAGAHTSQELGPSAGYPFPPMLGTEMAFLCLNSPGKKRWSSDSNHSRCPPLCWPWKGIWRLVKWPVMCHDWLEGSWVVYFSKWRFYPRFWKNLITVSLKTYGLLLLTKGVSQHFTNRHSYGQPFKASERQSIL